MFNWLRSKSINLMTLIAILLALGVVTVSMFAIVWSFTGKDVLKFNKEPIPVKPKFVKSEGVIVLDVDFCKLSSTPGRVTRTLESTKTRLGAGAIVTDSQQKGCYQYALPIPIPPQTPAGIYRVKYTVVYKTNPFQTVTEEIISEDFEVTE